MKTARWFDNSHRHDRNCGGEHSLLVYSCDGHRTEVQGDSDPSRGPQEESKGTSSASGPARLLKEHVQSSAATPRRGYLPSMPMPMPKLPGVPKLPGMPHLRTPLVGDMFKRGKSVEERSTQ